MAQLNAGAPEFNPTLAIHHQKSHRHAATTPRHNHNHPRHPTHAPSLSDVANGAAIAATTASARCAASTATAAAAAPLSTLPVTATIAAAADDTAAAAAHTDAAPNPTTSVLQLAKSVLATRADRTMLLSVLCMHLYRLRPQCRAEIAAAGGPKRWCSSVGLVFDAGPLGSTGRETVSLGGRPSVPLQPPPPQQQIPIAPSLQPQHSRGPHAQPPSHPYALPPRQPPLAQVPTAALLPPPPPSLAYTHEHLPSALLPPPQLPPPSAAPTRVDVGAPFASRGWEAVSAQAPSIWEASALTALPPPSPAPTDKSVSGADDISLHFEPLLKGLVDEIFR